MGTPAFAVPALQALAAGGHSIIAVYTRAPKPAGRGNALLRSPVHDCATAMGVPVLTPHSLRDADAQAEFASFGADVAVVAAYGLILPQAVLDAPQRGCLNIHASLLPRWRGAAPIQRAILAGDDLTGVTIMQMEAGLDTGPMIRTAQTPVAGKTAGGLTDELATLGAALVTAVIGAEWAAHPQPGAGVSLAPKISKAEARLDFSLPAVQVERAVRAFNPAPGAWCEIGGERLKILAAEVVAGNFEPGVVEDALVIGSAAGALRPLVVQRAGKPAMAVRDLLNGWPIAPGTVVNAST